MLSLTDPVSLPRSGDPRRSPRRRTQMKYWNQTPTAAPKGYRPLAHEQQGPPHGYGQHPMLDPTQQHDAPPPPPPWRRRLGIHSARPRRAAWPAGDGGGPSNTWGAGRESCSRTGERGLRGGRDGNGQQHQLCDRRHPRRRRGGECAASLAEGSTSDAARGFDHHRDSAEQIVRRDPVPDHCRWQGDQGGRFIRAVHCRVVRRAGIAADYRRGSGPPPLTDPPESSASRG